MSNRLLFLSREKRIEIQNDNSFLDVISLLNDKNMKLIINDENIELSSNELEKLKKDLDILVNKFIHEYDENIVILTGAGSSIIESSIEKSGKTMNQIVEGLKNDKECKEALESLVEIVKFREENINLEDLLSKAKMYVELVNDDINAKKEKIINNIKKIENKIREYCALKYDKKYFKHGEFLSKFLKRKNNDERLKIFTTNYDTLFEQAASDERIVVIDGFSFTNPSIFDGRYFDYDIVERQYGSFSGENSYINNVIHLYKLHGSIDWVIKDNKVMKTYCKQNDKESQEYLMIYPASTKFKQTYETPYFELFSRFISELKKKNTILIIIGFSFADEHLKVIVENALKTNRSLRILYVDVNLENKSIEFLMDAAETIGNVILLRSTFSSFASFIKDKKIYGNNIEIEGEKNG